MVGLNNYANNIKNDVSAINNFFDKIAHPYTDVMKGFKTQLKAGV